MAPQAETTTVARPRGMYLHLKVLLALTIVSVLPLTITFLLDTRLSAEPETRAAYIDFISQQVSIGGLTVHFYAIFVGTIFAASIAAAAMYMEIVFVRPVKALTLWVRSGKSTSFEKMPVMPHPHSHDVAALGQEIAGALAYAFQTKSQNVSLSTKKDELVVIAAHQLRTPLTGLKWAVQSLSSEKLNEAATARVGEIQATIQRIALIVDNIVASADIEEGRFGYSFSDVHIVELIRKGLVDLDLSIKRRDLHVSFDPPKTVRPVSIDAYRMTTAIYNVLENAVEYTPNGGTITISLTDRDTVLELSVRDTGIGVPRDEMQDLFTKFFRATNAKHMRPDGSGLGLYLAKHVVEAHGQEIRIDSTEGIGTTITIPLPYEAPKTYKM